MGVVLSINIFMPVIEFMNYFRKDISAPFYTDVHPCSYLSEYINSGVIAQSHRLSDDTLTKTVITKYQSLDCFNEIVNLNTVELRNTLFEFNKSTRTPKKTPMETYKLLGVDVPFKLTSTYTFPSMCVYQPIFVSSLTNKLTNDNRFELHGVQLLANNQQIIVIEQFKDSNEYNNIRLADGYWIPQLHKMQVTKHVVFDLI
jgi:hypothetical protein